MVKPNRLPPPIPDPPEQCAITEDDLNETMRRMHRYAEADLARETMSEQRTTRVPDESVMLGLHAGQAFRDGCGGRTASTSDLIVWLILGVTLIFGGTVSASRALTWLLERF